MIRAFAQVEFVGDSVGEVGRYNGPIVVLDARAHSLHQKRAYFCPVTGRIWATLCLIPQTRREPIPTSMSFQREWYPYMRTAPGQSPWHVADRPGSLIIDRWDICILPPELLYREFSLQWPEPLPAYRTANPALPALTDLPVFDPFQQP